MEEVKKESNKEKIRNLLIENTRKTLLSRRLNPHFAFQYAHPSGVKRPDFIIKLGPFGRPGSEDDKLFSRLKDISFL